MRLKIRHSHLTCKVADKCFNVRKRVEVVERKKMVHSLSLLFYELSVPVKENPDGKNIYISLYSIKLYIGITIGISTALFVSVLFILLVRLINGAQFLNIALLFFSSACLDAASAPIQ